MQSQSQLRDPQLWLAFPDDLRDETVLAGACALLSEEERVRAQRFRFDTDRRAFVAGRALARTALSFAHPIAQGAWRFTTNAHGKPFIDPECGLRFNIANCSELVLCMLAHGAEVGVDAEPCGRAAQILQVAGRVLSKQELKQLEKLDGAGQAQRALSLWVLKEAYAKARGLGFSLPFKKFSFVFAEDGAIGLTMEPGCDDRPDRWRFCLLDYAGHRAALVVEHRTDSVDATANLEVWEARSPQGPCASRHFPALRWFASSV